jgi:hypothetical protein
VHVFFDCEEYDHLPPTSVEFVHVDPHWVPTAAGAHAPFEPQTACVQFAAFAATVAQAASAVPDGAAAQVPRPFTLQRMQVPHEALAQHTPSVHFPLVQSEPALQV